MNITSILTDLRQRNIIVRMKGNDLSIVAEKGVLSPETRAILVDHKQAIVNYLRRLEQTEVGEIQLVDRRSHLPLSSGQQRLWFLAQLEPASSAYVIPAAVRIYGPLQPAFLNQALGNIIERHEVLRTVFKTEDGKPTQVILNETAVPLSFIDLRHKSPARQEAKLEECIRCEMNKPFDLSEGLLMRAVIVQLGEQDHVLFLALHHIVADGWSIPILVRELSAFYAASQNGRPADLPTLPVQYADYAAWQHRWNESAARNRQLAYWQRQLTGVVPLALPTDHPRKDHSSPRGATATFEIPGALASRLNLLGLQEEATPFTVFLTAFKVLLSRYSGQTQIAVGTPVANRERRGVGGLIGFFVNTLVLFTEVNQNYSFRDFLRQVRKTMLNALENQELPFEQLVDHLQPERTLNQNPLFQVMFILQNPLLSGLKFGDVTLQPLEVKALTAKFDLTLTLVPEEGRLQGGLNYNCDLFEPVTIHGMIAHYQALLEGIAGQPDQPMAELPLLAAAEQQEMLVDWNRTAVEYPKETVTVLFECQADKTPEAVAVQYADQQLTYVELNERANQLAHYLRELGVGAEVRVGLCTERSVETVVGVLGILKAGGVYVPLDPHYPPERLAFMVQDSDAAFVLTTKETRTRFSSSLRLVSLDEEEERAKIASRSKTAIVHNVTPQNLAYLIYTSGSTGQPKAVMICHENASAFLCWAREQFKAALDKVLAVTSICFDLSIFEIFAPLVWGGQIVLCKSVWELPSDTVTESVTLANMVPSAARHLLAGKNVPARVQVMNLAGEPLPLQLVQQLYRETNVRDVINLYGPSETTTYSSYAYIPPESEIVPIGRPIWNTQMYVLDKWMNPVPVGVTGELFIGGSGVARGYLNRPDVTAERFVPDHLNRQAGERLYRTGDKVRWRQDRNLEYLGRFDDQVKLRGYRIELGEIEAVLQQHPAVAQAAAVVRGEQSLVGYVVRHENGVEGSSRNLRDYLQSRLPEHMVPGTIMELERLPLTANGKLDRCALARIMPAEQRDESTYIGPRTPHEEVLANIWAELLQVERVGTHDNFFELGGHSLLATQLMSHIRKVFSAELPLRVLFETPTIAGLAGRIDKEKLRAKQETIPALRRAERGHPVPLSFAQQRLWFIDQLEPGSTAYNVPVAVRIVGKLNWEALQWGVQEIVNRHEVLRTRFPQQGGVPVQEIEPQVELRIEEINLATVEEAKREEAAARKAAEEAEIPFDLAQGPLVRVKLLRLDEQEHVLLVTMHHIVSDGWSVGIIVKEFSELYTARCRGEESGLPELPIQYADFSIWQHGWLRGAVLEQELGYWKQRLDGVQALVLPTDWGRPAVMSHVGASIGFKLGRECLRELKRLGRQQGTTLYMTCLAAWQALLYRYTGQEDIAVGSPIAGRRWAEMERLIGFFVNTLVLRSAIRGEQHFADLLQQVREITLEAYGHQDVPFEKVVEELEPERDLSRTPLFQVMFVLQNNPGVEMQLGELRLRPFNVESQTTKFDLSLTLTEEKEELEGSLSYKEDLFKAASIQRMIGHYCMLLESIAGQPDQSIAELPLLAEAERQQLLVEWNRTALEYPKETVVELFDLQAGKTPHALALKYEEKDLTYAELNARANQLAHYLRKLGVRREMRVGICMERSLEMVVAILAVLKAGASYVPLDPGYPQERLQFMAEDAQVVVLLSQRALETRFSQHQEGLIFLEDVREQIEQCSSKRVVSGARAENVAYLIYTSGSTGKPKGVMVTHGNVVRLMRATERWFGFNQQDVWTMFHSYAFDFSVWELWGALMYGGRLEVVPYWMSRSPEAFYCLVKQHGVTVLNQTPSAFQQFSQEDAANHGEGDELKLRLVIFGGEALEMSSLRPWFERHGDKKPQMVNMYGITETTVHVTCKVLTKQTAQGNASVIGERIPDLQLYLLRDMHLVPVGVAGEMYVGGAGLARGYWNRADLTAERFVPHPFSESKGERLYRTGDLGRYLADGGIEYLGRIDQQVKIRGHRIELGEIEAALQEHEAVKQAVVMAREDQPGGKRLVGYVVRNGNGVQGSSSILREYLRSRLPEYMVPGTIMELERLPLTANGKLDRRVLARMMPAEQRDESTYVGPRTPHEEVLANIWAELLQVERVGIHDNFFELGGHSLLAIQVISHMRSRLGLELKVRTLFEEPTIARLMAKSGDADISAKAFIPPPIARCSREGRIPLSFAQQRLWFLDQLEPENRVYHIPLTIRLTGMLDERAFSAALDEIVRRHEILRTSFPVADGRPYQMIWPAAPAPVEKIDLQDVLPESRQETLQMLMEQQVQKLFDLARGPLFRVALYTVQEQQCVICFIIHHIICDAWSFPILVKELQILYNTFLEHGTSPLPELPLQYADVAVWEQEWLRDEVLEHEVRYWREKLEGCTQILPLPTDFSRPSVQSFDAEICTFTLSPELSRELQKVCHRLGATEFMALLALMNVWLFRYSGQSDILIGAPVSSRTEVKTEQLIGFFLNTLVFRTQIDVRARFADLVNQVRTNVLEAYDHQDLPFEKLVDELKVVRDPSRNPLFQVMLNVGSERNEKLEFTGLLAEETIQPSSLQARFDIHLNAHPAKEGLELTVTYNCGLFQPATIASMLESFAELIRLVIENPEIIISHLAAKVVHFEQESTLARKRGDSREQTQKLHTARRRAALSESNRDFHEN